MCSVLPIVQPTQVRFVLCIMGQKASKSVDNTIVKRKSLLIHGYVRMNDRNSMIDDIIHIIYQYYLNQSSWTPKSNYLSWIFYFMNWDGRKKIEIWTSLIQNYCIEHLIMIISQINVMNYVTTKNEPWQ